jgi:hypothetical protein
MTLPSIPELLHVGSRTVVQRAEYPPSKRHPELAAWVSESSPAALCASAIALSLRWMLPRFRCPAHSAIYPATASATAGSGDTQRDSHHAQKSRRSLW